MSETTLPFLKPTQRPEPSLGLDTPEIIFLAMQVGRNVVAHEGEESGDTKGFVAVAEDLDVDGVLVEENAEPRDEGIDGDHA